MKRLLPILLLAAPLAAAAQCAPPTALGASSVTSSSAIVSFTPPAAPLPAGYTVTYQAPGGPTQSVTVTPPSASAQLMGLLPGTTYTVTVASNCGGTVTSVPVSASFVTGPAPGCPGVTNLVATTTATTLSVTATPAAGASGYFISYATVGGGAMGSTVGLTPQYTFTGLTPGFVYRVCVEAICPGGGAPTAVCASVLTPLAAAPAARPAPLALLPNPARHHTDLLLPADLGRPGGAVLVLDGRGRVLRCVAFGPGAARVGLELAGLAAGLYVVQVRTPQAVRHQRLVVE